MPFQIGNKCGLGHKVSNRHKQKLKKIRLGEKNLQWKGDKVGYNGVHSWVKRNKPTPFLCDNCKKQKGYDWANISQEYKRDLSDWEWLCRQCHMKKDGRIEKLKSMASKKGELNGRAKLKLKDIPKIMELNKKKKSLQFIANKFNVGKTTIWSIVNKINWI